MSDMAQTQIGLLVRAGAFAGMNAIAVAYQNKIAAIDTEGNDLASIEATHRASGDPAL